MSITWWGMLPLGYLAMVSVPLARADARWLRLPNTLVLPGLVLAVWAGVGHGLSRGTGLPVAAGLAAASVLGGGWLLGAVGMGDVKLGVLLATVGALVDPNILPVALGVTAVLLASSVWLAHANAATRVPVGPPMLVGFWFGVVAAFVEGW